MAPKRDWTQSVRPYLLGGLIGCVVLFAWDFTRSQLLFHWQVAEQNRERIESHERLLNSLTDQLDRIEKIQLQMNPIPIRDDNDQEAGSDSKSQSPLGPIEIRVVTGTVDASPVVDAVIRSSTVFDATVVELGTTDSDGVLRLPRGLYDRHEFRIETQEAGFHVSVEPTERGVFHVVLPKVRLARAQFTYQGASVVRGMLLVFRWEIENRDRNSRLPDVTISPKANPTYAMEVGANKAPVPVHYAKFHSDSRTDEKPPATGIVDEEAAKESTFLELPFLIDAEATYGIKCTVLRPFPHDRDSNPMLAWPKWFHPDRLRCPTRSVHDLDLRNSRLVSDMGSETFYFYKKGRSLESPIVELHVGTPSETSIHFYLEDIVDTELQLEVGESTTNQHSYAGGEEF